MEQEGDGDTSWCTWDNPQRIVKETVGLGNKRTIRGHLDDRDIEISKIRET